MMRIEKQIGPFHYNGDHPPVERTVNGTSFLIGIATAYNAFGLIGTEQNGVFILDDTNKQVVLDRHAEGAAGGYGPSPDQIAARDELLALDDAAFLDFIEANPRFRGIDLPVAA